MTDDRWTLHFDAMSDRTYAVQASLAGLPEAFTPCSVSVANADVEFAFDETTRVLTTTAGVAASGRLVVAACAEP